MAQSKSDNDPIKTLLADLPPAMFMGNPDGTVAIMEDKIVDAGGDADAVKEWVEERGGYRDKSFGVTTRKGFTVRPRPPSHYFYVVPEDALK